MDDLHYEIHLTVQTSDIPAFREACARVGVKPIILDLQNHRSQTVMQDVMTSSRFKGNDVGVKIEVYRLWDLMLLEGFDVVRRKIETVPWHPAAKDMKPRQYFEAHIKAVVKDDAALWALRMYADFYKVHLSRSVFKVREDGAKVIMVTRRDATVNYETFKSYVDRDLRIIKMSASGLSVEKEPEIEFALFDSNVAHDAAWIDA